MRAHLVIGASGLVGNYLVKASAEAGFEAVGTYWSHPAPGLQPLNICDRKEFTDFLSEISPQVVYLLAAEANVDFCEQHPEEAYRMNVGGVCNLVWAMRGLGAKLVFFSSDYLFDGGSGPYREEDPPRPLSEYGRQKTIAEGYLAQNVRDYLIVRTTGVYGWERQGKNFVCRVLDTIKAGRVLKAPNDQIGSPTYAPNLAEAVVDLVRQDAKGVYHVAGPERVNRYEFGREAARVFGLDSTLVEAVTTPQLAQPAPRPLKAGLVVEKAEAKLEVKLLGYREGLRAMAGVKGPVD